MARFGMVIDTKRCVGCMDCVVACKTENDVPDGHCRDWISQRLQAEQMPLVIIEELHSLVEDLRESGLSVVHGNAASSQTLAQANIASARCLIVAIANSLEAGQIISHARAANPSLQILARAQADTAVQLQGSETPAEI